VNLAVVPATLFFGWSVFDIVFLYWAENLVIGLLNVLRMAATGLFSTGTLKWSGLFASAFLIAFFCLHYGGFCYGHGVFVMALFEEDSGGAEGPFQWLLLMLGGGMLWSLLLLAGSHLYSFLANFIGRAEYRRTNVPALMFQPYARIAVLHLTILFGALVADFLGSPVGLLLVLIALKTVVDLAMHESERAKLATEAASPPGGSRTSPVRD
jgi:hypothetical protein